MLTQNRILIAVSLVVAVAALDQLDALSGVLAFALALGFVSFVIWLDARPKEEAPAIRGLHSEIAQVRAELADVKNKQEKMILSGRTRG